MIHIALAGAHGRMGQLINQALKLPANADFKLVAEWVRANSDNIQEILQSLTTPIDILVDFAPPAAVMSHLPIAIEKRYRMVIGSTGFTLEQKNKIAAAARAIPIVFAPNMSIAMNVCYKLLAVAASILKDKADMAILDIHHQHKKDAPSGTALKMAEIMATAQGKQPDLTPIPIHSLRLGEVVGEHKAIFALEGEQLEITHKASNRLIYAKGALQAARWIMQQAPGLYDMQSVLS